MVTDALKWYGVGQNNNTPTTKKPAENVIERDGFQGQFLAEKEKAAERILNGETETKFMIGGCELTNNEWKKLIENVDVAIKPEDASSISKFLGRDEENYCPYASLAKDGVIEYNGVLITCDFQKHCINIGSCGPQDTYLRIALPSGGYLNLNVENFGDIEKCYDMFSPEDLNAILNKIREYNHCVATKNKIEDDNEKSAIEELI